MQAWYSSLACFTGWTSSVLETAVKMAAHWQINKARSVKKGNGHQVRRSHRAQQTTVQQTNDP